MNIQSLIITYVSFTFIIHLGQAPPGGFPMPGFIDPFAFANGAGAAAGAGAFPFFFGRR